MRGLTHAICPCLLIHYRTAGHITYIAYFLVSISLKRFVSNTPYLEHQNPITPHITGSTILLEVYCLRNKSRVLLKHLQRIIHWASVSVQLKFCLCVWCACVRMYVHIPHIVSAFQHNISNSAAIA